MRRHFSRRSPLASHKFVDSFQKPRAKSVFHCAPNRMCTDTFQGLLIVVHVMNFCVCCFMIFEISRMVETCRAGATVPLAISVPEVSVLWNFGVYSFNFVHHIWSSQTSWAVFSNDACSAISKNFTPIGNLPLYNSLYCDNILRE